MVFARTYQGRHHSGLRRSLTRSRFAQTVELPSHWEWILDVEGQSESRSTVVDLLEVTRTVGRQTLALTHG